MAEGYVPQQRTGKEEEYIIKRVGELELEQRYDGSPAPLRQELDETYGPGGWEAREATPRNVGEKLYHNMGLLILEIYAK